MLNDWLVGIVQIDGDHVDLNELSGIFLSQPPSKLAQLVLFMAVDHLLGEAKYPAAFRLYFDQNDRLSPFG